VAATVVTVATGATIGAAGAGMVIATGGGAENATGTSSCTKPVMLDTA
jgi:hypothetical protein